jgi:hypothetical protein
MPKDCNSEAVEIFLHQVIDEEVVGELFHKSKELVDSVTSAVIQRCELEAKLRYIDIPWPVELGSRGVSDLIADKLVCPF